MTITYNMNEPWDSTGNQLVTVSAPTVFTCSLNPLGMSIGHTNHVALDGPGTVMNSRQPARLKDIVDGAATTLMVVEAGNTGIHWAEPKDLDIGPGVTPGPGGLSSFHPGGFHGAMADGSVRFISGSINPQTLKAMMTINGREIVGEF